MSVTQTYFSGINFPKITWHVFVCDSRNYMEKLFGNCLGLSHVSYTEECFRIHFAIISILCKICAGVLLHNSRRIIWGGFRECVCTKFAHLSDKTWSFKKTKLHRQINSQGIGESCHYDGHLHRYPRSLILLTYYHFWCYPLTQNYYLRKFILKKNIFEKLRISKVIS